MVFGKFLKRLKSKKKVVAKQPVPGESFIVDDAATAETIDSWRNLAKTEFPDFFDGIPDGELTDDDSDDDEILIKANEEKYRTKEDQDVAVFLAITDKMSLKSLLHILQGHVRSQNLPDECLRQYADIAESETARMNIKRSLVQRPLSKPKKFRWAEVTDKKVRAIVHEVECWKGNKELWWSNEERSAVRGELFKSVQFFRRYKPDYIASVQIVAKTSTDQEAIVEDHIKSLCKEDFARGLEAHILRLLTDNRKRCVQEVIEEQANSKLTSENFDTMMSVLRETSRTYSKMSSRFAGRMGKYDHMEALKASMSRWEPNT